MTLTSFKVQGSKLRARALPSLIQTRRTPTPPQNLYCPACKCILSNDNRHQTPTSVIIIEVHISADQRSYLALGSAEALGPDTAWRPNADAFETDFEFGLCYLPWIWEVNRCATCISA